jgi:hypothetical protein
MYSRCEKCFAGSPAIELLKATSRLIGIWRYKSKLKPTEFGPLKNHLINYKHHYVWRFNGVFCWLYFVAVFKFRALTKKKDPHTVALEMYSRIFKKKQMTKRSNSVSSYW